MTLDPGAFRPEELRDHAAGLGEAELIEILPAVRDLESISRSSAGRPSDEFTDRVMAAIAAEPAPRMAGVFARLRAHPGPAAFVASVRESWAMATRPGRAFGTRAAALAYVLAIVVVGASVGGGAAIGAAGFIDGLTPDGSPAPSLPVDASLAPSSDPSLGPDHTMPPGGSEEPGESEAPGDSAEPGSSDGSSPEPSSSSDDSPEPSGSPDSTQTADPSDSPQPSDSPDPSDTPRPSDTPKPSDTPDPSDSAEPTNT